MATYVISDIHGCYDAFEEMLKKIEFSEDDQLVLAGDYVDRGSKSLEMLRWLEKAPENVLLVKGNHDAEFAQCVDLLLAMLKKLGIEQSSLKAEDFAKVYETVKELLETEMFYYYGTLKRLVEDASVSIAELENWKKMIDDMPYYFILRVDGKKYIVVHAGYITDGNLKLVSDHFENKEMFYMYAREYGVVYGGLKDTTIVFGHTPTISEGMFFTDGNVFYHKDEKNNCRYFNIDCGAAYREVRPNGKLACMRLEDERIWYV